MCTLVWFDELGTQANRFPRRIESWRYRQTYLDIASCSLNLEDGDFQLLRQSRLFLQAKPNMTPQETDMCVSCYIDQILSCYSELAQSSSLAPSPNLNAVFERLVELCMRVPGEGITAKVRSPEGTLT